MSRLQKWLVRPVDGASLAVFRMAFGLLLCIGCIRFLFSGWIAGFYEEPSYFFKYAGFDWVQPGPLWFMTALYVVLAALALCIALGFHYRLAAFLFFLGFTYAELCDVTNYLNHYYLVSLLALLFCVVPLHRSASLDARRKPWLHGPMPAWALYLLRFQVALVYIYAGLAKVQPDWLLSAQPLNLWFQARTETPIVGPWLGELSLAYAASWAAAFFDLTIVFWLSWRKTRAVAFVAVLGFHLMTAVFFNIGLFPYLMPVCATLFFSPSWPRRFLRGWPRVIYTPPVALPRPNMFARGAIVLGMFYCIVQLLLPLRHYAYPGDVLWNEDGMRWSWKVMVREKHGSVTYYVRLPGSQRDVQVPPSRYLNPRQEREMAAQPDLILALAHHIADEYRQRGLEVEVRAEALVSLNGRPARHLIDPLRNLAVIPASLAPSDWVLPEPSDPVPQIQSRGMQ